MTGIRACAAGCRWPLECVLFALARTGTLLSALLAAFVGVNQRLCVALGSCPASLVLSRWFGPRSAFDFRRDLNV